MKPCCFLLFLCCLVFSLARLGPEVALKDHERSMGRGHRAISDSFRRRRGWQLFSALLPSRELKYGQVTMDEAVGEAFMKHDLHLASVVFFP